MYLLDLTQLLRAGSPSYPGDRVGLDFPSADAAGGDYPAHRLLLKEGIPLVGGLINLKHLANVLNTGILAHLVAFPLRIEDHEGSLVRAVALIN